MNTKTHNILEPNASEHGYSLGWKAFHNGETIDSNEFNQEYENELFEGYNSGWNSAKLQSNAT